MRSPSGERDMGNATEWDRLADFLWDARSGIRRPCERGRCPLAQQSARGSPASRRGYLLKARFKRPLPYAGPSRSLTGSHMAIGCPEALESKAAKNTGGGEPDVVEPYSRAAQPDS
jgi:hypothetical protein